MQQFYVNETHSYVNEVSPVAQKRHDTLLRLAPISCQK